MGAGVAAAAVSVAAGDAAGAGDAEAAGAVPEAVAASCACNVATVKHAKHIATTRLVILRRFFVIFVCAIGAILSVGLLWFPASQPMLRMPDFPMYKYRAGCPLAALMPFGQIDDFPVYPMLCEWMRICSKAEIASVQST